MAGPSSTWHRAGSAGSAGSPGTAAGVSAETPAGLPAGPPARSPAGPSAELAGVTASVPTCTMTWYTSGSSAPATFPARNASAMISSASARLEDVGRSAGSAGSPGTAADVSAETPASCAASCSTSDRCGCSRSPLAARNAFSSTAPWSGGSRNVPASEPSSSIRHASRRWIRAVASSAVLTCRCARAKRSSWFPVIGPASSARSASVSGVAIRVSARTLAYDSRPAPNSPRITGRSRNARATRTCSRAVPEDIWHFHDSQAAQLVISQVAQPWRASKSPSRTRNWQVAAARCPASSQICASSRSSGTEAGPVSSGLNMVSSGRGSRCRVSNMNLTLTGRYDNPGSCHLRLGSARRSGRRADPARAVEQVEAPAGFFLQGLDRRIGGRVSPEGRFIQVALGLAPCGLTGDVDPLEAGLGEVAHQVDAPCPLRQPLVREVCRLPARQDEPSARSKDPAAFAERVQVRAGEHDRLDAHDGVRDARADTVSRHVADAERGASGDVGTDRAAAGGCDGHWREVQAQQAGACLAGYLQAVPAAPAAEIDQQLSRYQVQRRGHLGHARPGQQAARVHVRGQPQRPADNLVTGCGTVHLRIPLIEKTGRPRHVSHRLTLATQQPK